MTESSAFHPDWISPPGDTIEDLLEEAGWTQAELARRTGFTTKHINELVQGHAALTADAAQRLSRVLGSTPEFWLVREAQFRAAAEKRMAAEALRTQTGWLKELPFAWMVEQGWVQHSSSKVERVAQCLRFFGVASVETWRTRYEAPLVAFRASPKVEKKLGAVAAWLRAAEREATGLACAPFDKAGFKRALPALRALTVEPDSADFVAALASRCARHGVAVVLIPSPPGCPISGATSWLTKDKAMLALSPRHRSNDHLRFTFFHEAGHLLLHGKKIPFVEGLTGLDEDKEAEADRFAEAIAGIRLGLESADRGESLPAREALAKIRRKR